MLDLLHAYSTWLRSLPPLVQPMVGTFTPSLPVWLAIAIYERQWIAAHGPSPAKKTSARLTLIAGAALFFLKERYPAVRAMLAWPDRHIPGWHLHWWQMVIGCLAAAFVAKELVVAFANLSRRSPRQQPGGGIVLADPGRFNVLPNLPPGFDYYNRPEARTTRTTYYMDGEG